MFHGFDEVFEAHLVGVGLVPHDFDEDEVVVIFGDLGTGHPWKIGQFGKLARSEHPLRANTALAMKDAEHILDHVHFLDLLRLKIKYLFVAIVHLPDLHVLLLL